MIHEFNFFGVGGDAFLNMGVDLLFHLKQFSTWGYSDVIFKLKFYKNAINQILNEVEKRECKVAILVDFQSFNLKLAVKLKAKGVNVIYYVAPQAWAWKEYRVNALSRAVHTLYTIIPFEKQWFIDRGLSQVIAAPHPLFVSYGNKVNKNINKNYREVLCLPGSRNFEVEHLLPIMVKTIELHHQADIKFSILLSTSVDNELYTPYLKYFDIVYQNNQILDCMNNANFAIAASGTVTLMCGLFLIPTVVCYKTSLLNQFIFDNIVNYRHYISLLNLYFNELVFPELLQDQVTAQHIFSALNFWYNNPLKERELKLKLQQTKLLMAGNGNEISQQMIKIIEESYE